MLRRQNNEVQITPSEMFLIISNNAVLNQSEEKGIDFSFKKKLLVTFPKPI